MAISKTELQSIILKSFPEATIEIIDLAGDEDHYSLFIQDASFTGVTLIKQHRMVKEALAEVLVSRLHAITIKTCDRVK
jgi:stress-induced morphogen